MWSALNQSLEELKRTRNGVYAISTKQGHPPLSLSFSLSHAHTSIQPLDSPATHRDVLKDVHYLLGKYKSNYN